VCVHIEVPEGGRAPLFNFMFFVATRELTRDDPAVDRLLHDLDGLPERFLRQLLLVGNGAIDACCAAKTPNRRGVLLRVRFRNPMALLELWDSDRRRNVAMSRGTAGMMLEQITPVAMTPRSWADARASAMGAIDDDGYLVDFVDDGPKLWLPRLLFTDTMLESYQRAELDLNDADGRRLVATLRVDACSYCERVAGLGCALRHCSACRTPYCGVEHQHADWRTLHKHICKTVASLRQTMRMRGQPDVEIMVLRREHSGCEYELAVDAEVLRPDA
jgi:hypothetical protein